MKSSIKNLVRSQQTLFCTIVLLSLITIITPNSTRNSIAAEPKQKSRLTHKPQTTGPLAEYVAKKDNSYGWKLRREGKLGATKYAELILTSQTWKNIVWKHQLFILNPSTIKKDTKQGLLFIAGGAWSKKLEKPPTDEVLPREAYIFATLAETIQSPVAILLQVPQQPIFGGKYEDAIIALTFEKYLRTHDATWPLLLPMTKSAVKGMDATQEFTKKKWSLSLESFTITGASKRGWTTWLTGVVDKRAKAIAPMVIDTLNMGQQIRHQKKMWGKLSYKIHDYTERKLQQHLLTPNGKKLLNIVDPYSYRKVLTQPKLLLLGTNDHYWTLDALNLYWKDLEGEKYIVYVPNGRHGLNDLRRVASGISALHLHSANGMPLPKMKWNLAEKNNKLLVDFSSDIKPKTVRVWIAVSDTTDFRKSKWSSKELTADKNGAFQHQYPLPKTGYAAIFAEGEFKSSIGSYFLSTNVKISGNEKEVQSQ